PAAHEHRENRAAMNRRKRGDVGAIEQLERVRRKRADPADQRLDRRVDEQQPRRGDRAAEEKRAQSEAAEEDGDQRGGGVDRVAENQTEVLQPDDLVEKSADAGGEKESEKDDAAAPSDTALNRHALSLSRA